MAVNLLDRAKMTVTGTPGTGAFTLDAAMTGYQSLADAGAVDGDEVIYTVEEGPEGAPTKWEVIQGVYTATGTSLSRVTTIAGTSGVSFTSAARVIATVSGRHLTVRPETVHTLTGTTPDIDPANGTIQTWTLTANSDPTESIADGESVTLLISGAFLVNWGTSMTVTWVGGTAPDIPGTGSAVIVLWQVGSTVYGKGVGDVA